MYTEQEQRLNSLVKEKIASLITALQAPALDLEHLRFVAREIQGILDPSKQKHLSIAKEFDHALREIIELRATEGDSKKLIEELQSQDLVVAAELHREHTILDLPLALHALCDRFHLKYVEGQDAPLLPRLLEMLVYSDDTSFASRTHLRKDNIVDEPLAIDIMFYGLDGDDLVKRIAEAYFNKFGVHAINPVVNKESGFQSMVLSLKTIVQDFLPSVTQEQVNMLLERKYCYINQSAPAQPARSRLRLFGCCG